VVPPRAAARRARPRRAAAPGLPASTTKSNSRTWRGRGVCDHFTPCAQVGDRSPCRLRAAIHRYSKPLADLVARDANEGDTRLLVTSIRIFHHWLRAQRLSWPVVMRTPMGDVPLPAEVRAKLQQAGAGRDLIAGSGPSTSRTPPWSAPTSGPRA
jgi:hypothetical protein